MSTSSHDPEDAALVENPDAAPLDPPRRGVRVAAVANGVVGFLVLLAFLYLGEGLRRAGHLPLPAPVIGLAALAVGLIVADRLKLHRHAARVEPVARQLLSHMGLLFVPAGTGILMQWDLVRAQWLPITAALLGSTLIGLASTGWVMQRWTARGDVER